MTGFTPSCIEDGAAMAIRIENLSKKFGSFQPGDEIYVVPRELKVFGDRAATA